MVGHQAGFRSYEYLEQSLKPATDSSQHLKKVYLHLTNPAASIDLGLSHFIVHQCF